jgi:solute carrier family 13 (sodium-dependent dicarboxylate transporter), member 2/3/5
MNEASELLTGESGTAPWVVRIGAVLSPAVFLTLWVAPLPLNEDAHRLAAIVGAVLIAWVTEVIPLAVTAVLIGPALTLAQISPAKQAFAAYADPILFLFVGSFFAARAMARHGLDRRFALGIAALPFVAGHPARVRAAVLVGAMLLSMWISNTGTTAILMPVLLGMLPERESGAKKVDTFAAGSLLALAHASTTGGLATLVGTPPNAITARLLAGAGHPIGFTAWMQIGVPIMLLMTVCVYLLVARFLPAGNTQIVTGTPGSLGPWSRAERVTALSFALAIIGWIAPDLAKALGFPFADTLGKALDPGAVAIVAASILFMVPRGKGQERVLVWRDAVQIEWGLILLFGGGIALGEAMFSTGLAKVLGEGFLALTGVTNLWTLTGSAVVLAIVLTEICSNTAAANMLVPLVIGAAEQLGVSPIPPALAVAFGASCGFMLPVATGPNALVYGTGRLRTRDMIRVGFGLDLLSAFVIFVLLYLLCPLLGWA